MSDIIIIATPSHAFSKILSKLKTYGLRKETILLIATKGLCDNPLELLSNKIENYTENKYAFISGPNFAHEVAEDKFTSIVIASKDIILADNLSRSLESKNIVPVSTDDIITTQISGIVKNIVAIKGGIMRAQGCGENAISWLISKGLEEISTISRAISDYSKLESLTLPSVIGDLVLTVSSQKSRNTKFGYELCKKKFSKDFLNNYPLLVEGVIGSKLLYNFVKNYNLKLPIIKSVYDILHK